MSLHENDDEQFLPPNVVQTIAPLFDSRTCEHQVMMLQGHCSIPNGVRNFDISKNFQQGDGCGIVSMIRISTSVVTPESVARRNQRQQLFLLEVTLRCIPLQWYHDVIEGTCIFSWATLKTTRSWLHGHQAYWGSMGFGKYIQKNLDYRLKGSTGA